MEQIQWVGRAVGEDIYHIIGLKKTAVNCKNHPQ
jgi:hypothetical protein